MSAKNPLPGSHCPVLIVGGGLAGLTTALLLAWRGIRPLLVERHAGASLHPRARTVNFRSMELLRVTGIEEELHAAGGNSFADVAMVTVAPSLPVTVREPQTVVAPSEGATNMNGCPASTAIS